jgi:protein SCO1/2
LLAADADPVRVVFVSVDPERDTPERVQEYVAHFGQDFIGVSGAPDQVARAARAFGVEYARKDVASASALGYLVSHSAYVFVLDPEFRWRLTFPFGVTPDEIAADLSVLMDQRHKEAEDDG